MIIITVTRKGQQPFTERFDGPNVRLGREPDNDLVLDSPMCSRYHAELTLHGSTFTLTDLGSTNGLRVEGTKVPEVVVKDGVVVGIGDFTLEFTVPKQESPKTMLMDAASPPTMAMDVSATPTVLYLHYPAGGTQRSVKIASGVEYVIGRSAGADVVIEDRGCSGRHALVTGQGSMFIIRDLGSSNGTAVNGRAVQEAPISAGDRITIGATNISVEAEALDSVDEDILMARTMHNVAVPQPPPIPPGGADADLRVSVANRQRETQERGRRLIWIVVALIAVAIVAVVATKVSLELRPSGEGSGAASSTSTTADPDAATVQVGRIGTEELEFTVTGAGSVTPQRQVTASAEIAARVIETSVSEGQRVSPREVLVRLDDAQIRLQLQEARSAVSSEQVQIARADYERKQRLFDDGAATRSALDMARNNYLSLESAWKSGQARIAQLNEQAAKTRIRSAISGTVARVLVDPGEFVGPGTPVVILENMEEVLVRLEVSDREVVRLRPLQVVEATSDAYPGRVFQGVIETIGSSADPVTRAFQVEARIGNPDGSLRSGMITTIRVLLEKRSCLVVPEEALVDDRGDSARVFLVQSGIARMVTVGLGNRIDRKVELKSGLEEGDEIVLYGQDQIRDGQRVETYR